MATSKMGKTMQAKIPKETFSQRLIYGARIWLKRAVALRKPH